MKVLPKLFIVSTIVYFSILPSYSLPTNTLSDIILKIDTLTFRHNADKIYIQGQYYLPFLYKNESEICELNIYPKQISTSVKLLKSPDYEIIDSLVFINQQYYRAKIKFYNLFKSQFLSFTFQLKEQDSNNAVIEEIKLYPYTKTIVNFYPNSDELYIGEEKIFELLPSNISNIKITNEWTTGNDINYRLSEKNGQLRVHLLPTTLGNKTLNLKIQTHSPYIDDNKLFHYELPAITVPFKVKTSRMAFLNLDKREITYDDDIRKTGVEITLDNHKSLIINKTYRIENQEKPGGALIAELFTKNSLANDKVLCIMRAYNLHRQTEGYLYIKDGDDAKFITNLSITPTTAISSIQIMRNGEEWTSNTTVYPGETIDVKMEGEGLHKARFYWEDVNNITSDTMNKNENIQFFKLQIPLNVNKRKISLYDRGKSTGIALNIKEYQIPRPFDYLSITIGDRRKIIQSYSPTVISRKTISDITLTVDNSKIDSDNKLYGKQYVDIDIKLIGKKGELIEMKTLKNVLFCPGENSPRSAFYKDKNCNSQDISLNNLLGNKTFNLEDFSQVQLEFKNPADKYADNAYEKRINIVLQHRVAFDIDVSFPAGLLIQNLGKTESEKETWANYEEDLAKYNSGSLIPRPTKPTKAAFTDNLGGISLALIAQFSFPDAQKVGKVKPYRLGAGFLAINAFNFSESAKRDLAAVVLASLYPLKPGKIFNLPIHLGFGYKFQDKIPFIMLSPGIGIRF